MTKQKFQYITKIPDEVPTGVKYLVVKRFFGGFVLGFAVAMVLMEILKGI